MNLIHYRVNQYGHSRHKQTGKRVAVTGSPSGHWTTLLFPDGEECTFDTNQLEQLPELMQ